MDDQRRGVMFILKSKVIVGAMVAAVSLLLSGLGLLPLMVEADQLKLVEAINTLAGLLGAGTSAVARVTQKKLPAITVGKTDMSKVRFLAFLPLLLLIGCTTATMDRVRSAARAGILVSETSCPALIADPATPPSVATACHVMLELIPLLRDFLGPLPLPAPPIEGANDAP